MMYKQLSFIEQVEIPIKRPIDYEIKKYIKLNKALYLEFERACERNCLYDRESPEYLSFKNGIKKQIIQNFLTVYQFCSKDGEMIQEYPILIKSIIQFINQFLLDFPLLQIEKDYISLAHFALFFKLHCSKDISFSYCLSKKKKYDKIIEEGKIIIEDLENLENTNKENLFLDILAFLYQIVTFSTLYVKQYTEEEKEIITTIGYIFLGECKDKIETTPYLLALDDLLNCFFKTYVPKKQTIKVLQKESKKNYQNRLCQLTIQQLEKNKED